MEELILRELPNPIVKKIKKGGYIYKKGDTAKNIYFVKDGRIKIESISPSRRITKTILVAGELFGEMTLFGEATRMDYACTIEAATIHIYPREEIQHLLKSNVQLQSLLLNKIANRRINIEQRLTSIVFKTSRSRVIDYLVYLGRKEGRRIGFDTLLRNFLPHKEIAYYTATSRQTVNTVLNELQAQNLVHYNRKRLLIRDLNKLSTESIAENKKYLFSND